MCVRGSYTGRIAWLSSAVSRPYSHNAVAWQHLAQFAQGSLDGSRYAAKGTPRLKPPLPLHLEPFQSVEIGRARLTRLARLVIGDAGKDIGKHQFAIRRDADFCRIIVAYLARIDIEMDEFGFRDGKGDALATGRSRPISEAAAKRHDDVGVRRNKITERRSGPAPRCLRRENCPRRLLRCRSR
jgi:hypothetical protein